MMAFIWGKGLDKQGAIDNEMFIETIKPKSPF